jgi:uncharacterized protein YyaL (SSP411 family)
MALPAPAPGHPQQPRPASFDDKILADWNGLAIAALAEGRPAARPPALDRCRRRAQASVLERLWDGNRLRSPGAPGRGVIAADGFAI